MHRMRITVYAKRPPAAFGPDIVVVAPVDVVVVVIVVNGQRRRRRDDLGRMGGRRRRRVRRRRGRQTPAVRTPPFDPVAIRESVGIIFARCHTLLLLLLPLLLALSRSDDIPLDGIRQSRLVGDVSLRGGVPPVVDGGIALEDERIVPT